MPSTMGIMTWRDDNASSLRMVAAEGRHWAAQDNDGHMAGLLETSLIFGDFIALYLAFRVKHLAADYFLQTPWMARGKGGDVRWMTPLFAHAAVHGLGTGLIAMAFAPSLWWLGLVDVVVHASIDRIKALPAIGGRWQPSQAAFWWCHGIDQEAHNLTHLVFIAVILLA